MNRNMKMMFLLSIFVVLFVAASSVTAADSSNATATSDDSQVAVNDASSVTTKEVATTTTSDTHSSDTSSISSQSSSTSSSDTVSTTHSSASSDTQVAKTSSSSSDTVSTTHNSSSSDTQVANTSSSDTQTAKNTTTSSDTVSNSNIETTNSNTTTESQSNDNSDIKANNQIDYNSVIDQKTETKKANTVTITEDNGLPEKLESNTIYILDGVTIKEKEIEIIEENITLTGTNNANIEDTYIYIGGDYKNITISDLKFTYTSNYNQEEGIYLDYSSSGDTTNELAYVTIENCNFTIESRPIESGKEWYPINSKVSNIKILNNNFEGEFYCYPIDYNQQGDQLALPPTGLIRIVTEEESTLPAIISGNNFTIDATPTGDSTSVSSTPTFQLISVKNAATSITENKIDLTGYYWMYTIRVYSSNSNVSSNNITVNSERYAAGIYLSGNAVCNNIVENNIIDLTVGNKGNDGNPEDVAYCIVVENFGYTGGQVTNSSSYLSECTNNTVRNNELTAKGNNVYGVELYGTNDTKIIQNTMELSGQTTMGVGLVAANSNITNNTMRLSGNTTTAATVDYITARTAGICSTIGFGNNMIENTIYITISSGIYDYTTSNENIINNTIIVENYTYGIELENSNNSEILSNNITVKGVNDNYAVDYNGDNITFNSGVTPTIPTAISLDNSTISAYINETIHITGTITDTESNNPLNDVRIWATVESNKNDTRTDSNGYFDIELKVPEVLGTLTVTVSFEGSQDYMPTEATLTLNVSLIPTQLVIEPMDSVYESTVIINGTLSNAISSRMLAKPVTLYVNGIEVATNNTYTGSTVHFNYTIEKYGTNTVYMVYEGEEGLYEGCTSNVVTFEAVSKTFMTINDVGTVKTDSDVTITGTLIDDESNPVVGDNLKVTATIDGKTFEGTVDNTGNFSVVITTPETAGTYELEVSFAGDEDYDPISGIVQVVVVSSETKLTVNDLENMGINSTTTITGRLTDADNNGISNAPITVTIDGKEFTGTTGSDGSYTIEITAPSNVGTYQATVYYAGDDLHDSATAVTDNFDVEPLTTTITIDNIATAVYSDKINITGSLIDENNNPVANQNIVIEIDDVEYTTSTDSEGKFSYEYLVDLTASSYEVTVTYDGNDVYRETTEKSSLTVNRASTTITVNGPFTVDQGESIEITGVLTDQHGNLLEDKTVTLTIASYTDTITTNNEGVYSFTYTLNDKADAEQVKVEYTPIDMDVYYYLSSSTTTTISSGMIDSTLTINPVTGSIEAKSKFNISGTLKASDESIANADITISFNGENIETTTDSNGQFTYELTAPSNSGDYTITVTYPGSSDYRYSQDQTTVTINTIPTTLVLDDIGEITLRSTYNVTGRLTDSYGGVEGKTIKVTIDGKDYTGTTNSDGSYSIEITAPSTAGTYTAVVNFDGDQTYASSTDSKTVTVNKKTLKINIDNNLIIVDYGDSAVISGTIVDSETNELLNGITVTIQINGTQVYSATTSSDGKYSYTYQATKVATNIPVLITTTETSTYLAEQASAHIDVEELSVILKVNDVETTKINVTIPISGTVVDQKGNNVNEGTIKITINNQSYSTDVKDGKYSYDLPGQTTAKTYDITVEYDATNTGYQSDSTSTKVDVEKLASSLTVNSIESTIVGSTFTVSGTLKDEFGNNINNQRVSIKIDGSSSSTTATTSNGAFTATLTASGTSGDYNVVVSFDDNDYYTGSSKDAKVSVEAKDSEITVNDIDNCGINSTFTVSGTLKDGNNGIGNARVTVTINGKQYNGTTTSTGSYSIQVTAPSTSGRYNVVVNYAGNGTYNGDSTETTLDVEILSTTITVNTNGTYKYGQKVTISGTLTDENKNPVSGVNVNILIHDDYNQTVKTNSSGGFTYTYTVDLSGTNIIEVVFDSNLNNKTSIYTSSNNETNFTALKLNTTITLNVTSVGDTITITGVLKDENNNVLSDKYINITVEGYSYSNYTNSNGVYSFTGTLSSHVDSITVSVRYPEDQDYYSSTASTTHVLGKLNTTLTVSAPSTASYGSSLTINGTLKDYNGNAIQNATVTLSINGNTATVSTDSNGTYKYNYATTNANITSTKQLNITATYNGTSKYANASAKTTSTINIIGTNIEVVGIEGKNGYNVTLTAYVTDENGNPINYGQATFKLNGVTMKVNGTQLKTNVVNGVAQINFTIPNYSAKDYNLTAVYGLGDVRLEDSDVFTIIKSDPELKLTSITSDGTTGHITGMLLDEHGVGVDRDTKVAVKINGKTVLNTRIYNGVIDLTFDTSEYKNGIHNLTIIFGENGCYNTVTYNGVIAQNIVDCVVVNPVSGKDQQTVTLNAYFIDENGNSVTSGSATFKLNGVTIKENGTQVKVNIVNGVATYNFTIPDYSAKDYNLTAVGSVGTTRYENSSVLTVLKTDTHLDLSSMSISQGSNAQLVGTILDEKGNPVNADTKIAVKINGKTVLNTRVSNGTINLTLDTSSYSAGSYNVTVVAGENGRFATSTADTILTIKS